MDKSASLQRFAGLLTSLARIYKLPLQSLHIFYDLEGPLIAFNRNASIFLNLRFYEAWRKFYRLLLSEISLNQSLDDAEVARGKIATALVSWQVSFSASLSSYLIVLLAGILPSRTRLRIIWCDKSPLN